MAPLAERVVVIRFEIRDSDWLCAKVLSHSLITQH